MENGDTSYDLLCKITQRRICIEALLNVANKALARSSIIIIIVSFMQQFKFREILLLFILMQIYTP